MKKSPVFRRDSSAVEDPLPPNSGARSRAGATVLKRECLVAVGPPVLRMMDNHVAGGALTAMVSPYASVLWLLYRKWTEKPSKGKAGEDDYVPLVREDHDGKPVAPRCRSAQARPFAQ